MTALPDADFARAIEAERRALRAYARNLGGHALDPDDLVQDTMLRAWKNRSHFESGTKLGLWLRVILHNLTMSAHRRRRWDGGSISDLFADWEPSTFANQEARLHLADAQRAFDGLPEAQRSAVYSAGLGDAYEDIAAAENVAIGTVKSRVARGRAALAEALA